MTNSRKNQKLSALHTQIVVLLQLLIKTFSFLLINDFTVSGNSWWAEEKEEGLGWDSTLDNACLVGI
jgi:hypothetical protein